MHSLPDAPPPPAHGPTVAFVHGCTQGPTAWAKVRDHLSARGIPSIAVDLDPTRFGGSGSVDCAVEVVRQLSGSERVLLVTTSCSGILAPVVAGLRPLERLVFVCAGLPDIGRSTSDQIAQDGVLCSEWTEWMARGGAPDDPDAARRFMFHDCPEAALEWSLSTVRLFHPAPVYDEIAPMGAWPDVPSTYILGTRDRIISRDWAMATVPSRLGVAPVEIDTGHCPQNSRPELLAELLAGAALKSKSSRV